MVFFPLYNKYIDYIFVSNKEMKNKIVAVTDTGYTYSDKVLRYAKVVVGQ